MKEIVLKVPDREYSFFMKLIKSLGFVDIKEVDEGDSKEAIVENLKQGFKEMQLIKDGKLKTTSAKDFLKT